MQRYATTFEEHVQIMAIESPHGLILDWWRRLSLAIDEYFKVRGLPVKSVGALREEVLAADPYVGLEVVAQIRELRRLRNTIAHEDPKPISPDKAAQYAQKALDLISLFGKAQSAYSASS